jgi:uncharacterized cupin superfamily protein
VSVPEAQLEDFGSGHSCHPRLVRRQRARRRVVVLGEQGREVRLRERVRRRPVEFAQFGINVTVLEPGQTVLYHAESNQEGFLVLSGERALLVEDEERRLQPWDFFHSSEWTEHAFVGAGEGPCVILMVGSRSGTGAHYPVSELAARYGASVVEETSDWRQAFATVEHFRRERPPKWARLPWA